MTLGQTALGSCFERQVMVLFPKRCKIKRVFFGSTVTTPSPNPPTPPKTPKLNRSLREQVLDISPLPHENRQEYNTWTSLVVHWIIICLPMQVFHLWSWKVPHASEQLLSLRILQPILYKRSHGREKTEKTVQREQRAGPAGHN